MNETNKSHNKGEIDWIRGFWTLFIGALTIAGILYAIGRWVIVG